MANFYQYGTAAKKEEGGKVVDFRTIKKEPKNSNYKANYKVGEKQEVYPFKTDDDLKKMYGYFSDKKSYRDRTMFVVGINVGLRAGDLLSLTWGQIYVDGAVVNSVTVKEEKTGKFRTFYFNDACKSAIAEYFDILVAKKKTPSDEDFLFASNKGGNIDVRSAGKILKTAAKEVGIKYNVGTHSMRKTFGYHQLKEHNGDALFICQLQKMFGHSSPEITLRYCGLEGEQIEQYYNEVNLCNF